MAKGKLTGAAKAAHDRKAAAKGSGSSGGRYTADMVRRAFGGAVTFSDKSAAAAAAAINDEGDLGSATPDDAGRRVQTAVSRAVHGKDGGAAVVSIDTALRALTFMHAELNTAGEQVGGGEPEPVTVTRVPEGGGTAAAAGGASSGPGTATDTG